MFLAAAVTSAALGCSAVVAAAVVVAAVVVVVAVVVAAVDAACICLLRDLCSCHRVRLKDIHDLLAVIELPLDLSLNLTSYVYECDSR